MPYIETSQLVAIFGFRFRRLTFSGGTGLVEFEFTNERRTSIDFS